MTSISNVSPPLSPVLLAGFALRPIPPALLQPPMTAAISLIRRRHPDVFERLGDYDSPVYKIDPVDLPYVFILRADMEAPQLTVASETTEEQVNATIRGPLMALVELMEGRTDGDALFFSRDLVIEGDTEVVVALRNAVDGAEIDLRGDIMALFGPLAGPAKVAIETAGAVMNRATKDLETLRDAFIAPPMRKFEAQDAKLRKLEEKVSGLERKQRRGRNSAS